MDNASSYGLPRNQAIKEAAPGPPLHFWEVNLEVESHPRHAAKEAIGR
jgi:hypothetical protein